MDGPLEDVSLGSSPKTKTQIVKVKKKIIAEKITSKVINKAKFDFRKN